MKNFCNCKTSSSYKYVGEKGIAIGSLFSQYAGAFFLTYFGHWLKEEKKIKYLYIYCDDIVILHSDKDFLHNLRREISE